MSLIWPVRNGRGLGRGDRWWDGWREENSVSVNAENEENLMSDVRVM